VFCNGEEVCDPTTASCAPGAPPTCVDDDECTRDSCDPGRDACKPDLEAHMALYPIADKAKLSRIRTPSLPKVYFRSLQRAISSAELYGDVIVSVVPGSKLHYPDLVAELADFLLRLDGVRWAWVLGPYEGDYFISCRSVDRTENAAAMLQKVVGSMGQGGGHENIAGGKVTIEENKGKDVADALVARILRVHGKKKSDRQRLVPPEKPEADGDAAEKKSG